MAGKILILAVTVAVGGVVAGNSYTKEKPVPEALTRPVKVITVAEDTDVGLISLPGKTRACRRADLSFKVAGPLVALPVEEGQAVEKGQVIARIDPRDFQTRVKEIDSSLAEARANLKSMKRGARIEDIRMLEADVAAAEADYHFAQDQYKRYRNLWEQQHASRADFDRQTSRRNMAKARLNSAMQDLAKGKKGARKEDIEAQQSRIRGLEAKLKAAQDALDDTCLRAPFSGVVAKRHVENHQEVQAKAPIVFLQDLSQIEVVVDVPETLAAQIRKGYAPDVAARFACAQDKTFPLTLKEFSTKADPQTLTYQAVLVMPRPQGVSILPGMTATVDGRPKGNVNHSARIAVPAVAVTWDADQHPYVWTLNEPDMTVKKTNVRVGNLTGSENIMVLEGLIPGQKIVTAGVTKLQPGMTVTIWEAS